MRRRVDPRRRYSPARGRAASVQVLHAPGLWEIINTRVYNGVHYRFSGIAGAKIGRQVARWVAKHNFRPVDSDDDDVDSDDSEWRDAQDPE